MNISSSYGKFVAAALLVVSVAGCTNNMIIVAPLKNNAAQAVAKQCQLPPDQKGAYGSAIAVNTYTVKPERASKEHVDGCASVKFQLDEDGNVTHGVILTEKPEGYGYGQALLKSVKGSQYKPPISTEQWYYVMTATVYSGPASAQ